MQCRVEIRQARWFECRAACRHKRLHTLQGTQCTFVQCSRARSCLPAEREKIPLRATALRVAQNPDRATLLQASDATPVSQTPCTHSAGTPRRPQHTSTIVRCPPPPPPASSAGLGPGLSASPQICTRQASQWPGGFEKRVENRLDKVVQLVQAGGPGRLLDETGQNRRRR